MMNRFAAAVLVSLGSVFIFPASATDSHAEDRKVTVTGVCSRSIAPDRGSITITADFRDMDLKAATRKTAESYERLRSAVGRLNLENLETRTSEYQVTQVREWEKSTTVFKGYQARMGLWVSTSSIQKLGDVIAVAAREGIRDVGQLSTYLSDEKSKTEHFNCLQEAAEDAKARAQKLAGSLNARLGNVIAITENVSWERSPIPVLESSNKMVALSADSSQPAPSVEAGKQKINVSIQAAFALQ